MSDQSTLQRTLEMMAMLSRPGGCSRQSLKEHFAVHIRTIQRTLDTIRDAGYVVECHKDRYKINRAETKKDNHFDIGDLLHFSKEEAWLLNDAIKSIPGKNSIKENLVKKLYSIYAADNIVNNIVKQEDSEQVRIIVDAIQNRLQIVIKEYTYNSVNKGLRSLIAEPIAFASDFTRVWAYLPIFSCNILLRLSGLAGVEGTTDSYECSDLHRVGFIDVFRGYGIDKKSIGLRLDRRAYGFMCEEFPLSRQYIKKTGNHSYELHTEVCDFTPVARFYLGLPGDIYVLYPEELKEFIASAPEHSQKIPSHRKPYEVMLSAEELGQVPFRKL